MKVAVWFITPLVGCPLMLQLPVSGQTKILRGSRSDVFFLVTVSFKYGLLSASGGSAMACLKSGNVGLHEHNVGSMLADPVSELWPEPGATRNMKKRARPATN